MRSYIDYIYTLKDYNKIAKSAIFIHKMQNKK